MRRSLSKLVMSINYCVYTGFQPLERAKRQANKAKHTIRGIKQESENTQPENVCLCAFRYFSLSLFVRSHFGRWLNGKIEFSRVISLTFSWHFRRENTCGCQSRGLNSICRFPKFILSWNKRTTRFAHDTPPLEKTSISDSHSGHQWQFLARSFY